jgi:hypothetical protein
MPANPAGTEEAIAGKARSYGGRGTVGGDPVEAPS